MIIITHINQGNPISHALSTTEIELIEYALGLRIWQLEEDDTAEEAVEHRIILEKLGLDNMQQFDYSEQ